MASRRRTATVAVVLIVGLCAAPVAYFGSRPWRDRPSPEEAGAALSVLYERGLTPKAGWRTTRVAHSGWRDVSWWYRFEVPPADVPAIEAGLTRGDRDVVEVRTVADVSPPVADFAEAPFWWDPEGLPDAKVLHVRYKTGETMGWYIVSRRTGVIYYHPWSN